MVKLRKNPFEKFLTAEDHIQMQVVQYLRWQYRNVLFLHCPNEGKRTPFEQYKAKVLGITAGVPDLLILKRNESYCGLAIELKAGKNKPTPAQIECMKKMKDAGWCVHVCYDFEKAKRAIDHYFNNAEIFS